ncbi:hypothetical protein BWQ96_09902 [Gracilariopsis chorda]|uniref:DUF659 domain-containing protein n=1 Tax=Gracilariopsis chorda TaxID=448386 RepID=A0A2V3IE95_9FLOR|nr:hypothetical protein BWQ96_09902 [Gracilariopsis chorda]|eukprot:PXF40384.1 hypothetical protein BWQ96_09902 [Gracilariopsis chorda]
MTGRHAGLLTFMDRATGPIFIRVWCSAHQLDLIMADVYGRLLQNDFYSVLTALIGYQRRQQNLVAAMKTKCPKVALTRWMSMIKVMTWVKKHRIAVQAHLDDKLPPCRPSAAWWVLMMAVHSFGKEASLVFTCIQGMTTLVSQQVVELSNLSQTFCRLVGCKVPVLQSELQSMAGGGVVTVGSFAARIADVKQFVCGHGSFVSSKLDEIPTENGALHHALQLIGAAFLSAAAQLTSITVERNAGNEQASTSDQLPPVMPHELVKHSRSQFCSTVCKHILRLQAANFAPQQIEEIEEEQGELIRCYHAEDSLRLAMDACDHKTSFRDGWSLLGLRVPALFEFAGGLATVVPGTATVEADFPRLRREKDIFRQNLSDFGLQCVLHAQQYKDLLKIRAYRLMSLLFLWAWYGWHFDATIKYLKMPLLA